MVRIGQLALAIATFLLATIGMTNALAQTYTVLYGFAGPDGGRPEADLIQDSAGNFYGTTYYGGAWQRGVVFKLDAADTETVLHSFAGKDENHPTAPVIRDQGRESLRHNRIRWRRGRRCRLQVKH